MIENRLSKNKGFTLVELIVAIAVFVVAIIPIYNAVSSAVRVSVKSRKLTNANIIAENVQTAIKTFSVDDFLNIKENGGAGIREMLGITNIDAQSADKSNKIIKLDKLKSSDSSGEYSAKITYTTPSASDALYSVNQNQVAIYSDMSGVYKQPYEIENNPDIKADDDFKANEPDVALNNTTKTRVINITVSGTEVSGVVKKAYVMVEYVYTYSYKKNSTRTLTYTTSYKSTVFPEGYEIKDDDTVVAYIMYYPWYSYYSTATDAPQITRLDTINIYNEQDIPLNLFLVKQDPVVYTNGEYTPMRTNNESKLLSYENIYSVSIHQYFSKNFNIENLDPKYSLYTNADVNLVNDNKIMQMTYNVVRGNAVQTAATKRITGDIVAMADSVKMINYKIEIYKSEDNFDDDKKIYSCSGTKLN